MQDVTMAQVTSPAQHRKGGKHVKKQMRIGFADKGRGPNLNPRKISVQSKRLTRQQAKSKDAKREAKLLLEQS